VGTFTVATSPGWLSTGILRQDLAWFDREENSTAALTARLATEVTLVKNITGLNLNRQGGAEKWGG